MKFSATYLSNMYRLERGQRTRNRCYTASHTGQRSYRFGDLFGRVGQQQGMPLNEKKQEIEPGLREDPEPIEPKHMDYLVNAICQNGLLHVPQALTNTESGT